MRWVPKNRSEIIILESKRYEYNLNENSIVFDLGSFDGEWSQKLFQKYKCNIYAFEPVSVLYKASKNRLEKYNKIKVFNFGISNSDEDQNVKISLEGDMSSMYNNYSGNIESKKTEICLLKNINALFKDNKIKKIDLLKLNIEGAEFDLLDYIIKNNIHKKIKNIQVQFHDFIPNHIEKRNKIINNLSKTHKLSWNYPWVLENWEIK